MVTAATNATRNGKRIMVTIITAKMAIKNSIMKWEMELSKESKRLVDPTKRKPLEEYLSPQRRFRKLNPEQLQEIKKYVNDAWETITKRVFS